MAVPALLAAGTANASVNLHNADGVVVDMSGTAEIQYIKQYENTQDAYLRIDDADLLITTSIDVTDTLSAVAGIGFKFEGDTFDTGTTESDETYVGLRSTDFGVLTFGRQILIADDVGNSKDFELGTEDIDFVIAEAHQVVKWVYDNGMFYAGADFALDTDPTKSTSIAGNEGQKVAGARFGVRASGLDARVYLYDAQNAASTAFAPTGVSMQNVTGFNLEGDYVLGQFDFSASYGQVEYKDVVQASTLENKNTVDFWQLSAGFQANEKTYFALGLDALDSSESGNYLKYKSNSLYANVSYKLHKNAMMYAEVGQADIKIDNLDKDPDVGYLVGMEVTF